MKEHEIFGCPDWRDDEAYASTKDWSEKRWRWEFLRRKQATRLTFQFFIEDHWKREFPDAPLPTVPLLHEHYRDVRYYLSPAKAAQIGLSPLPNPSFSHEDWWDSEYEVRESLEARRLLPFHIDRAAESEMGGLSLLMAGDIAITFSLGAPIAPQLECLRQYLEEMQHPSLRPAQKLHHSKRLTYLRVLDASEQKATLREISDKLLQMKTAGTPQAARDVIRSAKRYRDSV